ncbi:hypothetical protein K470DRAFT_273501 [Piedraia hortae CBS 480.64]|uniref:Uncharacterized protein n=1 Tax=Piedraia hortae CBS 480.64 TaxID=1314780 RepID=A0A6A7BP83_9PEZI|nr:hypothetical protein K470DRAFT_273501 [Piedraia hortae CBS 480.64]
MIELAGLDEFADLSACISDGPLPWIIVAEGTRLVVGGLGQRDRRGERTAALALIPLLHVRGDQAIALRNAAAKSVSSRRDAEGLAVDRGDPAGERCQVGQGVPFDAEGVGTDPDREHAREPFNHGDEPLRAMDDASAHASDADNGARQEHALDRLEAADVVVGRSALQDRHEAIPDTKVSSAGETLVVGRNRTGDPVENLFAVRRDAVLAAIVDRGHAPERVRGGKRHVVGYRPRQTAVAHHHRVTGAVEVEADEAVGVVEGSRAPPRPFAPAIGLAPARQAVGGDQHRCL